MGGSVVRLGLPVVVVLVLVLVAGLSDRSTRMLLQAVSDLGPISGWRCAQSATYSYDPRHDWLIDSTLLSEPPEALLPGVEVERVEASLRGGDAVVWGHIMIDSGAEERRVYVVSPGRLRTISLERSDGPPISICSTGLGAWKIVGEHALG